MHTLLDLHGNIPTFISITSGKVHDVNILDEILPEAGAFCVFRAMPITVPRRWRSRFRTDADHDSEMMAIAIPTGSRSLFGGSRNGDRHRRNHFLKLSS
jgi:hypothetical protein